MAWNYRRRVKLIPGVRLNFSKNGISTSIGFRGANITFGSKGTYLNTGIPGTGLYNRQKISSGGNSHHNDSIQREAIVEPTDNIISVDVEEVTSHDMQGIKEAIINAHKQRNDLSEAIKSVNSTKLFTKAKLIASYIFIIGFISKKIKNNIQKDIEAQKQTIVELEKQRDISYVNLDIEFDDEIKIKYEKVVNSFKNLMTSQKIWHVTTALSENRVVTRSYASISERKKEVRFDLKSLPDIKSKDFALFFKNSHGADIFFYPNFIVMQARKGNFGLIDFKELDFNFKSRRFVEKENVPSDSKIIDTTWAKVNKNGSPDRRFKDNYQIPVVRYGTIALKSSTGMHEEYEFSNYEVSEQFASDFNDYKKTINGLPQVAGQNYIAKEKD